MPDWWPTLARKTRGTNGIPVLFVGGCMRSGTTLMRRFLRAAPGVNPVIAECQHLSALLEAQQQAEFNFDLFGRDYFRTREELAAFGRGTLRRLIAAAARSYPSATLLVLKMPNLSFRFSCLARLLPEASFILTVRDPRDIAASICEVAEHQREAGCESQLTRMNRDMRQLSRFILDYYADTEINGSALTGRLLAVRYEDLVRHEPRAFDGLARFTGLPIAPQLADLAGECWRHQRENSYTRSFWSEGRAEQAANDRSIGAFRECLSDPEASAVRQECDGLGRRFGYW